MLDHYSHIRIAAKRTAPEALETPIPKPQPVPEQPVRVTVN
jgi:hypothetical protein